MKDSQPAWQLKDRDENSNVAAVVRLLTRSTTEPSRIVEFFGGVGGVTKAVRGIYPDVPFETWDMDERCLTSLSRIDGVTVKDGDSIINCRVQPDDGVLMDFNLWTILRAKAKYASVMRRTFAAGPRWVQLTDSSLGKMHLNFSSYGLSKNSWREYCAAVNEWAKEWGYALVDQEVAHYKTVMLLFLPK